MANDKEAIDPDDCPRLTKIAELMNRLYEYSGDFTDADVHAALSDAYDAGFDAARPEQCVAEALKEERARIASHLNAIVDDVLEHDHTERALCALIDTLKEDV